MPHRVRNKTRRDGRLSHAVRIVAARHVPRGGAFLLPLGTVDQEGGSADGDRLGSDGVPHAVHLLLGVSPFAIFNGSSCVGLDAFLCALCKNILCMFFAHTLMVMA